MRIRTALFALCVCSAVIPAGAQERVGIFEGHGDVGVTPKAGSIAYDSSSKEYRVTGGGENVWATADAFQFAWQRLSGDVTITADVHFVGTGAVDHRKAMLMVRQDLTPGSPYADVALHGDGLTALQYRQTPGAETLEIRSDVNAPVRIRIERRGNQFTMSVGKPGEELKTSAPANVTLQDPVYVGIGVCSHDANILETAVFSNVTVEPAQQASAARERFRSRVSVYDLNDKSNHVIFTADQVWEAPNWSPDGKYLLINSQGKLYRLPPEGGTPERVDVGPYAVNNDKTLSPDGKQIAFSASSDGTESQVFVCGADGSNARLVVSQAPSYFHGWSPDGKWLAFVGQRDGKFGLDRAPATGGQEERLTAHTHYDDGPDYSPDGKWIYFNSDRAGKWEIWRMPPAGAGPKDAKAERVTQDDFENWFPHPSPDGKWLVFLSFPPGTKTHDDRLDVQIRRIPLPGKKLKPVPAETLVKFYGGQGTINVNSWSPDSTKFAYVVYERLP